MKQTLAILLLLLVVGCGTDHAIMTNPGIGEEDDWEDPGIGEEDPIWLSRESYDYVSDKLVRRTLAESLPNLETIYISNSDVTAEELKQLKVGLPDCQIIDPSELPVGLNYIRRSVVADNKFGKKVGLFIAGLFESAIQEIPFNATWVHIRVEQDARPKSAGFSGTTGPLREFEEIVTEVKERIRRHSPYQQIRQLKDSFDIPTGARNKWNKEEFRYSNVRYDVIETDSLKSPYKGTIKISVENRSYIKHDEDGYTSYAGLFDTPEEAIANPNYYTGQYSTRTRSYLFWYQNGRWVPDAGYSFPITSKDL